MNKAPACQHKVDPATIEFDRRHGRIARCVKCGAKLAIRRMFVPKAKEPSKGKIHMSKKVRRFIRTQKIIPGSG